MNAKEMLVAMLQTQRKPKRAYDWTVFSWETKDETWLESGAISINVKELEVSFVFDKDGNLLFASNYK